MVKNLGNMTTPKLAVTSCLLAGLAASCGGNGSENQDGCVPSGTPPTCEGICDFIVSTLPCTQTREDCLVGCETGYDIASACKCEVDRVHACSLKQASTNFECNASGVAQLVEGACVPEADALKVCLTRRRM